MKDPVEGLERTYTAMAFALTVFSGLLTIMGERFLYKRRCYAREAAITAFFGWLYVIGGILLYVVITFLRQLL